MTANLTTPRLHLRPLMPGDLDHLTRLLADPQVMRYLSATGAPRSRAEAEEALHKHLDHWRQHGYGVWAVEERDSGAFVGRCGLRYLPELESVEVLWALGSEFWGRGYATEAAHACLRYAFETLQLERVIAFTWAINDRSRRVMEKLGMHYEKTEPRADLPHLWYAVTRYEFDAQLESLTPHA